MTNSLFGTLCTNNDRSAALLLAFEEAADLLVSVFKTQRHTPLACAFGMLMVRTGQCLVILRLASGNLDGPLSFVFGRCFAVMAHGALLIGCALLGATGYWAKLAEDKGANGRCTTPCELT